MHNANPLCIQDMFLKSRNHLIPCQIHLNLYNRNETQQRLALNRLLISEVSYGMTSPTILKKHISPYLETDCGIGMDQIFTM